MNSNRLYAVSLALIAVVFYEMVEYSAALDKDRVQSSAREYCITEDFEAQCLKNEVVLMTRAVYGRMRIGRCLEDEGEEMLSKLSGDPRFLGCSVDVTHLLDQICSGVNQCRLRRISDLDLEITKPCHAALKSYLEASYDCITVVEEDRSCTVSVSSSPLHIMSSSLNKQNNCGTRSHPWILEAPAGQQINVSLLDFGSRTRQSITPRETDCLEYGYVLDKAAKKNISICNLNNERIVFIHQSLSNVLQLFMHTSHTNTSHVAGKTLIGVKAVGCSDLIPPEDMWLRRVNHEAVVGCYTSRQSWHLRCVDKLWIGVIGNCSREIEAVPVATMTENPTADIQIILAVAVGFIGLVICLVIVVCGVICLKRYSVKSSKYSTQTTPTCKQWQAMSGQQQLLKVHEDQQL